MDFFPLIQKYDLFQNISCPIISLSKSTCNTNVQSLFPGVVGQYYFKYCLKDTKEEDTAPYSNALTATKE